MAKLIFLIVVFIVAVGLSFYFSAEGFEATNTNDIHAELWAELSELDKTMTYLKSLGINPGSKNDTYDKTAKRISEINAILIPTPSVAETPSVEETPSVASASPSRSNIHPVLPLVATPTNVDTSRPPPFPPVRLPDGSILAGGQVEMCPDGYYFYNGGCAKNGTFGGPGNSIAGTCESNRVSINGICWGPCPPGTTQRENKCIPSQAAPSATTDANGNVISNRLKDLISILTQSSAPVTPANVAAQQQARASVPASTSDNSGNHITTDNSGNNITLASFYETIKPQIQKDVSQAVRQEFERSTVLPKKDKHSASTPSLAQGVAWPSRTGCNGDESEQPDMSEYIRKDSIPCWGCDVKY